MYAGAPLEEKQYEVVETEGLKVFVPKGVKISPKGVTISLAGKPGHERLEVVGLG